MTTASLVVAATAWLTTALLVVGSWLDVVPHPLRRQFEPDVERNLFTVVSAGALIAAAVSVIAATRRRALPAPSLVLAGILTIMAADEWLEIHERVEQRLDMDWNVLYLPAVLVAAVAGLLAVRRRWPNPSSFMLLAGGTCWFAAYLLEDLQWNAADEMHRFYAWMMVSEELLELGGSLLLAGAAWLACAETRRCQPLVPEVKRRYAVPLRAHTR